MANNGIRLTTAGGQILCTSGAIPIRLFMLRTALLALGALLVIAPARPATGVRGTLDRELAALTRSAGGPVRVIVETDRPAAVERLVDALGGTAGWRLPSVNGVAARISRSALPQLAAHPAVRAVRLDRALHGTMQRAAAAVGARWVADNLGVDGSGIGVATVDSGFAPHDDLPANRIVHFVDFVDRRTAPHDGYGHGTHVAGIIAGTGRDSDGARRGIAPGAHLVVLRALDRYGEGYISNAIAALDYAVQHRAEFNIRVVNLSVAAGVYESYRTDPLTIAAARAVDAGIVVVTAAGNLGRDAEGRRQHGGITSPGNAPWVLTVGAANSNGTVNRADDTVAAFSSIGPTAIDGVAKPDLVAPGVGIESLADPDSTLFMSRPEARIWGTAQTLIEPYISLSGSSMAAPMVAGTAALILQANPALTPAAVKAILRSSAERHEDESELAQGAGFLNARAAVTLARTVATNASARRRLERLVRADAATAARAAACEAAGAPCGSAPVLDCAPACFSELAGAIVGVAAPAAESVTWRPYAIRRRP